MNLIYEVINSMVAIPIVRVRNIVQYQYDTFQKQIFRTVGNYDTIIKLIRFMFELYKLAKYLIY